MNTITEVKKALAYQNPKDGTAKISGFLSTLLAELDADLADVLYEPSDKVLAAIADLRKEIKEFEDRELDEQIDQQDVEPSSGEDDDSYKVPGEDE
jgi:hypothetical protein